jgi:putative oxidoreductase
MGRILVGGYFLASGILKTLYIDGLVDSISSLGLPMPELAAVVAIVIEVAFGIALVVGYYTRFTAVALAVWIVTASSFFPDNLLKNLAITGGLLYISAYGAGRWKIEREKN